MSTTEPAVLDGLRPEQRLHPMSWLFVLLQQLRQFIVPLAALLVFGQGDRNELWPLIGVAVLVVVSVWRYFTYRYSVQDDRLVIRSGVFERSARIIPFARIHNVALQQSVLHRVFRVAEVKLESAGGKRPEAEMRVLSLDHALALEALVRQRGQAPIAPGVDADGAAHAVATSDRLLYLPTAEVLRLGLVSNRGLVIIAAGFAGLSQFGPRNAGPDLMEQAVSGVVERATGYAGSHGFDTWDYALASVVLVGLAVAALRLLSILMALLQYHGFQLSEQGRRLTIERGLAARWRTSLSRRRIQAWTLHEGLMHRWLHRRSLHVEIATGGDPSSAQRSLHELAPIATPPACDALVEHLLPHAGWPRIEWTPLPPGAWWRLVPADIALTVVAAAVLTLNFGVIGLLALLWLPVAIYAARRRIQYAAYAIDEQLAAVRDGWWSRTWRFAEVDKLQALEVSRTPLDRWCGTASLLMDTAGGGMNSMAIRIRFIPLDTARALHAELAAMLAKRPLRW